VDLIKKGGTSIVNFSAVQSLSDSSPSEVEKTKLDQLIHEYRDIFREDLPEGLLP
jgi:hypothetical protein